MIIDGLLIFTSQTPSPTSGDTITTTGVSTNAIDLHMAGLPVLANNQGARDLGVGDDPALKMLVQCLNTFAGGTSLQIALQGATDNGSGAPAAFSTYWLSPVYALATLVQGARLYDMDLPRPPAGVAMPRFLQLSYTIVGTFSGPSKLFGAIVLDRIDQAYNATSNATLGGYPPGVTIAN